MKGVIRMKRFFSILLSVVVLMGCLSAGALAANYVYFSGTANVRTGPGLGYASIGQINSGSTLPYLQSSSYDNRGVCWYKVSFSGSTGWVSSTYASLTDNIGNSIYAANGSNSSVGGDYIMGGTMSGSSVYATANANVRSGPGLGYSLLDAMSTGDYATFLGNTAYDGRGICWYNVQFNGKTGWVSSAYTTVTGSSSGSNFSYSGSATYGSYVKGTSGDSNVRTGPGLGYASIGCLYQGCTATYLGNTSVDERGVAWYYVNVNGTTGWVSSRYTTLY